MWLHSNLAIFILWGFVPGEPQKDHPLCQELLRLRWNSRYWKYFFPSAVWCLSLQWGNNTNSLPCVIRPFHLVCINQMWLDSLHKFHWRVMTLISSLWKRSAVVAWLITGEVSGEKCFYSVTDFCFGGLPLLMNPLCTEDSSVILSQHTYLRQWQWCWRRALTWMLSHAERDKPCGKEGPLWLSPSGWQQKYHATW